MIDFSLPRELEELKERTRRFVREVVIPTEARDVGGGHGVDPALRVELQQQARAAGLLAPHVGRAYGGLGLDMRGRSVVLEEAGYSVLGPQALNCAAPDEGNMHLLELVANEQQKQRYLVPLAAGATRSCFAMTEPAPGAGSDPAMLRTRAERSDGGWVINGRKHFITGAEGAAFAICMARTEDAVEDGRGATLFLVEAENEGMVVGRPLKTMDSAFVGGHFEVEFRDCRVADDAVLGEPGLGFRYAQARLAPARLTHCMRWLGLARRALDIALDRAAEREAFGSRLGELGMVQALVADCVIDIESSRALIQRAAWVLDSGGSGRGESQVAKVHVSEAVGRQDDRGAGRDAGLRGGAADRLAG